MVSEDETAVFDDSPAPDPTDELVEEAASAPVVAEAEQEEDWSGAREPRYQVEEVIACFSPCGRCGYFLAGYWATNGRKNFATAVRRAKSGWITLSWNMTVRELVLKSFGSYIEEDNLHFEGCCSECHRHFIYRASRTPNHPHTFRIEIKPRKRQ